MKITALTLSILAMSLHAAEPNALTDEEKKAGFVLLFDGKTLEGWRGFKKDKPGDPWVVEQGTITLTKGGAGDIMTEKKFANFELRLEFQIAAEGNSGIMWRVSENHNASYQTGPEYQILDSFAKKAYQHEISKGNIAGAFYDMVPAKPEFSKPAGEWNEAVITIDGSKITLSLNGKITADLDSTTHEYKNLLAKSKFATWPHFNKEKEGHICLQDHGDVVRFRSVRIREIK